MRAGRAAVIVALVLAGGCTSGDGGGFVTPTTPATTAPATTAPAAPTTTLARPDPGTVSLRVTGLTLPAAGAGGSGLRLLVDAASAQLIVRRSGGAGAVTACPVPAPTGPADASGCVDVGSETTVGGATGAVVTVPPAGGVEVRAAGAAVTVGELSVTYVAVTRATTVVTPARPAGACGATACEATYTLVPAGAGPFALDGRAGGGRPRLVLTAGGSSSNRMLATVEGGGSLSIRATLEAGSEARLLHQEQGPGPVAPLTAEISWP